MARKYSYDKVLFEIEQIVRVWTDNPTFTLGEITLPSLQSKITNLRAKHDQVETLRTQLIALSNELTEQTAEIASIKTRALSGLRAVYGPDSTQYEQGGGTRTSERKRSSKKSSSKS
ncbi:MAG: hypothetical protein WCF57_10960 [Pyrinomonadaceae bacterium]